MRIALGAVVVVVFAIPLLVSPDAETAYGRSTATTVAAPSCIVFTGNFPCCSSDDPDCDCLFSFRWCNRTGQQELTFNCSSATLLACFSIPTYVPADSGQFWVNAVALCSLSSPCENQAGGSLCEDICTFQPSIPCAYYNLFENWVPIVLGIGGDCGSATQ